MKLVVLAGAKKDAAVPLKKDRFVIGRSSECSLRAGSDAISRRHCELERTPAGVIARDLGSRNGTFVNDERLTGDRLLENGDLLRVGPLEFRFETEAEVSRAKAPKVESPAEAVARTAERRSSETDLEASISDWLLPADAGTAPPPSVGETQSFRSDETKAILAQADQEPAEQQSAEPAAEAPEQAEEAAADPSEKKSKKEPGKLPKDLLKPKAKDSREAADQFLRNMARRR